MPNFGRPPLLTGPAGHAWSWMTARVSKFESTTYVDGGDEVATTSKFLDRVAAKPLVKSRQRVQDHAEVLTPAWLVDDMLDLVKDESERIDSRFLEPACGTGNFLVRVLARKLATVKTRYGRREFEKKEDKEEHRVTRYVEREGVWTLKAS